MRNLILAAGLMSVMGACVSNKKYVYLQKDDVNKKGLPVDSVVRVYNSPVEEYKIQPLDILSVRVESLTEPDFNFFEKLYKDNQQINANQNALLLNGFLVDPSGNIQFPVVGSIKVAGLSVFQTQDSLQRLFSPFLKNPIVRVRLLNFRFTVLGEVNQENLVTSPNSRITIMEAIGLAGGLTDLADRSSVKVIRQKGQVTEVFYINLLRENAIEMDRYYVQQNDVIIVPALRQRPFRKYVGQNLALFVSTVSVILLTVNLLK